jgi:bacterioferritin (cytochrome b1)
LKSDKVYSQIEKSIPDILKKPTKEVFDEYEDIRVSIINDATLDLIMEYHNSNNQLDDLLISIPVQFSDKYSSGYYILNNIIKSNFNAKLCGDISALGQSDSPEELILSKSELKKRIQNKIKPNEYTTTKQYKLKADIAIIYTIIDNYNYKDEKTYCPLVLSFLINIKDKTIPIPHKQLFFILLYESIDSDFNSYTTTMDSLYGPVTTVTYNIDSNRVNKFDKIVRNFNKKMNISYNKKYFYKFFLNKNPEIKKYVNRLESETIVEYDVIDNVACAVYSELLDNITQTFHIMCSINDYQTNKQIDRNDFTLFLFIEDPMKTILKFLEKDWVWLNKYGDGANFYNMLKEPPIGDHNLKLFTKEQQKTIIELLNKSFTNEILNQYKSGLIEVIIPQTFVHIKMLEEMLPNNLTDEKKKEIQNNIKRAKTELIDFLKTLKNKNI